MQVLLFVIPANPEFSVDADKVAVTRTLLQQIAPINDGIDIQVSKNQMISGSFENLKGGRLTCPLCGQVTKVDSDELDEWWSDFQDQVYESADPREELATMPCCGENVVVKDLDFGDAVCFSKLVISINEPIDAEKLTGDQLSLLEATLGCKLVQFDSFGT